MNAGARRFGPVSFAVQIEEAADEVDPIHGSAIAVPVIADQYAWLLGATGLSQALAIIAGAMGVRFLLQSVPFVRWGS